MSDAEVVYFLCNSSARFTRTVSILDIHIVSAKRMAAKAMSLGRKVQRLVVDRGYANFTTSVWCFAKLVDQSILFCELMTVFAVGF